MQQILPFDLTQFNSLLGSLFCERVQKAFVCIYFSSVAPLCLDQKIAGVHHWRNQIFPAANTSVSFSNSSKGSGNCAPVLVQHELLCAGYHLLACKHEIFSMLLSSICYLQPSPKLQLPKLQRNRTINGENLRQTD